MSDVQSSTTPSTLQQRLREDLTASIRSRDEVTSATIRLALTAIRNEEVAGDAPRDLGDEGILAVLGREAKKRREAAAAFDGAGRADRADRERAELAVLEGYLPRQMDAAELADIVSAEVATAAAAGAAGMPAMGRVMKAVQARVAGRAEGGRVAAEVRSQLTR
jgi:uncharacterized protein YqeY